MKKELIWNTALLLLGIFIVHVSYLLFLKPDDDLFYPGSSADHLSLEIQLIAGSILGLFFILLRYVCLGIIAIPNANLRLGAMLLNYLLPLSLVFFAFQVFSDRYMASVERGLLPVDALQKSLSSVRKAGFFKSHTNEPDRQVLEQILGKCLIEGESIGQDLNFFQADSDEIDLLRILRWDSEKVLNLSSDYLQPYTSSNFIIKLGEISEGHFKVGKVLENRGPNQSETLLTFTFKGQAQKILVSGKQDEAFEQIKIAVNALLKEEGYQFYHVNPDYILGLSADEKASLKTMFDRELI
jgi:hypothetical protein